MWKWSKLFPKTACPMLVGWGEWRHFPQVSRDVSWKGTSQTPRVWPCFASWSRVLLHTATWIKGGWFHIVYFLEVRCAKVGPKQWRISGYVSEPYAFFTKLSSILRICRDFCCCFFCFCEIPLFQSFMESGAGWQHPRPILISWGWMSLFNTTADSHLAPLVTGVASPPRLWKGGNRLVIPYSLGCFFESWMRLKYCFNLPM